MSKFLLKILKIPVLLWNSRIFKFSICGVVTATFNIFLLSLMINLFKIEQPLWRNLANVVSIEISLLFSFFVYRTWVWSSQPWIARQILRREIPLYHLSCAASIAARSFILFPLLDWMGVNYAINSLIGIALGSGINYLISDRVVFRAS